MPPAFSTSCAFRWPNFPVSWSGPVRCERSHSAHVAQGGSRVAARCTLLAAHRCGPSSASRSRVLPTRRGEHQAQPRTRAGHGKMQVVRGEDDFVGPRCRNGADELLPRLERVFPFVRELLPYLLRCDPPDDRRRASPSSLSPASPSAAACAPWTSVPDAEVRTWAICLRSHAGRSMPARGDQHLHWRPVSLALAWLSGSALI